MKTEKKYYTAIDFFRLAAAMLIIAIHTSPLASLQGGLGETGDFILTRIIARVAVPFFFMTSGFFLISRYNYTLEKLGTFVKKTALIYGIAILIYIPINIYNGYFGMDNLMPNLIKDIVFDGTLYHLWYLPASIIGGMIAWYLVKRFDYKKAFVVSGILYMIGLFGDSYYGLIDKNSVCSSFYALIFQVSDYTRNGIFFAPVFFIMGGFIADNQDKIVYKRTVFGNRICFSLMLVLMLAEGLTLHYFHLQRHDSMYVFLPLCVYFLFSFLLYFRGNRHIWMRDVSLIVYLIHPMMIVVIRMAAKVLHLQSLLVDNSMVHFLAVATVSVLFSVVAVALWSLCRTKKEKHDNRTDRAYIEIHLENLAHNVRVLNEAMPPKCELMAVVKAEAYGHGMYEIATHLDKMGVRAFATATIDEAIKLRRYGVRGEILILGYTAPARAKELRKYNLTQTLIDYDYAYRLNEQGYHIKAHIKIDTGMHRLGFASDNIEEILCVFAMNHICVNGIFTHLCVADSLEEDDVSFTRQQIAAFYRVLKIVKKQGIRIPKVHIQSSYGLLNYPELKCSYVRAGISLYGVLSAPNAQTKLRLDLRPVLSLKSKVILLRFIKEGESVGYGRTFTAQRDSIIAILPVGYADGFPRNLSNTGSYVLIHGNCAPIVGRICRDSLAVDVTDIPDIAVGMTATLIGWDNGEEITAPTVAGNSGSITNELLSRMGGRLGSV
ncbi:MAG: serine racemase VanT catalytic subunit [Lachnospiraceae bacterium]|nr:serine racemase VanT catalytic subunit [Lachnospiraceae bacterium]